MKRLVGWVGGSALADDMGRELLLEGAMVLRRGGLARLMR